MAPAGETALASASEVLRPIFNQPTISRLKQALAQAVNEGTASKAKSELYTTAGKTGTTEKVDPATKAYSNELRLASFAGFAPVADPHLVVYVAIDEPQVKPYYGGVWAAPVFREIIDNALKYLNVRPDNVINYELAKGIQPSHQPN